MSGTFRINDTVLIDQPTVGRWIPREVYGVDGTGHPIHPALRSFEMSWELISSAGFAQLYDFYRDTSGTMFISCDIPRYADPNFLYVTHSGCVINEPQFGDTFYTDEGYIPNVRLIISNITSEPL